MCETRDLGPKWHALLFEEQRRVDMRQFAPQDVKKMLRKQNKMTNWKECAAKNQ